MSTTATFLGLPLAPVCPAFVALVGGAASASLLRYLPLGRALIGIAILATWIGYVGAMGWSGIVGDPTGRPPGIVLLLTPVIAFVAIVWNAVGLLSFFNVAARAVLTANECVGV